MGFEYRVRREYLEIGVHFQNSVSTN